MDSFKEACSAGVLCDSQINRQVEKWANRCRLLGDSILNATNLKAPEQHNCHCNSGSRPWSSSLRGFRTRNMRHSLLAASRACRGTH